MVEELKLAIKIDDATIEQSLLKQFANAQKMADKVVLDFKNVNFDDKQIEAKFKEMQKKAGQNPIDFSISGNTLDMLGQIDKRLTEIFSIGKGKSFIDSSSTVADIGKIENKINELNKKINTSFDTKNKTEAYNQLKKYADAFKDYYNNEEAMASESGTKAAYAYYKAYEEALKKEVAQSKLEKVTVDFDINDKFFDKNRIVSDRIKEYANYKKYGSDNDLLEEISSLKNKLFDFNSAYSQVKEKLGQAAITPEIIKSVERYVELLDKARFLEQLNDPDDNDTIKSHRAMAQVSLDDALFNAQEQSYKYTKSLRQQEEQLTSTVEAEQKLAEVQKETTSNSVTSDNSQIEELKSDIQEVKTELGDVKDRISSIESNGFENVREDVEKTKESVKELNSELTEIKSNLSSAPQESNISSGSNPAIEQQNKLQEELKETQQQAEETKSALNDLSNIKGLKHYTDEVFDKFDNNMFGSGIGENRLGKAAYFFDEKNSSDWEAIGEYSKYLTTWSAEQVKIFDQTLGFTEKQINQIIKEFYSDVDEDIQEDYKFDLKNIMDEDLYEFKSKFGIELQDVMESLGYDALKTNSGEYAFYNTDKLVREVQVYDQEANKIIDINNKVKESIKETSSDQTKDAFPKTSENLEQVAQSEQKVQQEAVATDKALNNISFTPNTEGFEDIITKFGILREQAEQITKIVKTTKQTADGTPNISYKATLKNGSSYYLGKNSTPQVLNASETVYDAKVDNAKKLEREKQIWNELTTSFERYATIQKRIASNNALSTDNEEAIKLLEHIHELQRNDILPTEKLTVSNEKLQQINQTVTDLKAKLKESTLNSLQGSIDKYQKIYDQRKTYSSDFTPSEQYTKNLTELDTAIGNLVEYRNTLKNVSEVTVKQEAELKGLVTACEKASDSFKSLSASEKGASQIAIDKLVQRINKDLDECTNYSKEAKLGLRALRDELESTNPRNLKEITSEIINIENAEIRAGRAGRSFFDTLKNSGFHQIAAQMAGMFGLYDAINLGRQAISTIVDLDDALLDLKKTTSMSSTELNNFYYSANDVAKQMGVTTKSIIEQASAWSRLGYSSNEQATEMAKLSSKFASISPGMDTDQAQEGMVSIMKAWQINPEDVEKEILDPINQLGKIIARTYSNVWCYQKIA